MAKTAYEEALEAIGRGESASVPSYITAADTLNIANGNQTFLESAADAIESIPKFIGLSVISGANQLYNIPADVGNLLGGDFDTVDTGEVIAALDSDYGQFYKEHQDGIDLVGFMVSSLLPGTMGVKVLNAGQKSLLAAVKTGDMGANSARAAGLLLPRSKSLMRKAIKEVADNTSPASIIDKTGLQASIAGVHQSVLEGIFFETAVAATMFNSPILENQDFGDFVLNIGFSAGVFGLIGGTVSAAGLNSALKKAAKQGDIDARPYTFIDETASTSTPYEKLAIDFEGLAKTPALPENVTENRLAFLKAQREDRITTLEQRIKITIREIAGEDESVTLALNNALKKKLAQPIPNVNGQLSSTIALVEVAKLGVASKRLNILESIGKKLDDGKPVSEKEAFDYMNDGTSVRYAKMHGEGAGGVVKSKPLVPNLADTLRTKKGQVVVKASKNGGTVNVEGVKKYVFSIKFLTGPKKGATIGGASRNKGAFNIFRATPLEAQAYSAIISKVPKFAPTAKTPLWVPVDDVYVMEKVLYDLGEDGLEHVKFTGMKEGEAITGTLQEFIGAKKVQIANRLLFVRGEKGGAAVASKLNQDEIASIVDVKNSMLSGQLIRDPVNPIALDDMFATRANTTAYRKDLVSKGLKPEVAENVNLYNVPQHLKMIYNTKEVGKVEGRTLPLAGINNFVAENMATIKIQQRLYQKALDRSSADALGPFYSQLVDIGSDMIKKMADSSGAGYSFVAAASANYGTLANFFEQMGKVTANAITARTASVTEALEPLLYRLANNQKAYLEWSTINAKVRSIEGEYGLNVTGDALEPLVILRWRAMAEEAAELGEEIPLRPEIPPSMDELISLRTQEVRDLAAAHIELNAGRTGKLAGIRTAQGLQFNRSPDAFYPIPIDTKQFPHFATVTDESITSGNQVSTLYASTAAELDLMAAKVRQNPELKVRFKKDIEDHHKAEITYNYEKTLSDNYIDVGMHRTGSSTPFFVATDKQKIVDDMLNWHVQRETGLVREAVSAKYEIQFEELHRLGEGFTKAQTSKFSSQSLDKFVDDAVKNPFASYIKTGLAIRKNKDYPFWTSMNQLADQAYSRMMAKVFDGVNKAKTPAELAQINKHLQAGGYRGAAYDASMNIFANAKPASGSLVTAVRNSNSVMATVVLRLDAMNAMVNAISANILLGAETKAIIRAINESGSQDAKAAIGALSSIKVPGTEGTIMSAHKMIGQAMSNVSKFIMDEKSAKYIFAKENGYLTKISDQYRGALNDLAFDGVESIAKWDSRIFQTQQKLKKLADKGEQWTGNRLAEEFNRLVAVDVMQQFTDVARAAGVMSKQESLAYINTFVNRTQGNYLASQRPGLFQGPIGQAIGLFQTYQFNLMQQLLRHVGEGHAKDAMTLIGLQGTIHGMNGLPAFNAINTHIVGTASGNDTHRDAYDAVYGIAGKEAGDWLMYGLGSNALGLLHPDLKMNLYTRGDINPRHVTIVPVNPASVPIIQASVKVIGNIFNTAGKLAAGGDITTTLLQGLEHNAISRPLAGLAQTLQGFNNPLQASYNTDKRGNVIVANDLLSLANLGRLAGGKPLDAAIALDATYRMKAYGAADTKRMAILGQAIKTTMIAGQDPTQEQINDFAQRHAEAGGRQEEFNTWFNARYKEANLSQANAIQQSLTNPFAQSMQRLMGGQELEDFTP